MNEEKKYANIAFKINTQPSKHLRRNFINESY